MLISKTSPLTGKINTMDLDIVEAHITLWQEGKNIQDVMPHLNDNEREFLITGYTSSDWEFIFGEEEEREDF